MIIGIESDGSLGDLIMLTSALVTLRKKYPEATIYLKIVGSFYDFFQGLACVDHVGVTLPAACDLTYNLHGVVSDPDFAEGFLHPSIRYHRALGLSETLEPYQIPEMAEQETYARERLPETGYIACVLASHRPSANWSARGWKELFLLLPEEKFVLFGSSSRPSVNVPLKENHPSDFYDLPNVLDFTGQTTQRQGAALMKRCRICISVDTGFFHVASALQIPTILLAAAAPGWCRAPLFTPTLVLQGQSKYYPCAHSIHGCCERNPGPHCLEWITPEIIIENLKRFK